jgi:hypothetical protein
MPYISKRNLSPTSKKPDIRLCCDTNQATRRASTVQAMLRSQPETLENQKKMVISSLSLRLSATVKVNMPLINQIAEISSLFIRLLFVISTLSAQPKKVIKQITTKKRQFPRF